LQDNNTGDSFEQLQDLFNEMFQGDAAAFPSSSSCSTSNFTSSRSFVFDTNSQRSSSFATSSMGMNNDPFGYDPRAHSFSLGVRNWNHFKLFLFKVTL